MFNRRMLRLARTCRGLSQTELAKAVGVGQPMISMIEDGDREASEEQIALFSEALDFPCAFFFQQIVHFGPGIGEVFHRRRKVSARTVNAYYGWASIKADIAKRLLDATPWPDFSLPVESASSPDEAEAIARMARAKLHLPIGPIESMTEVLESAGVLVIPEHHGHDQLDGMSVWMNGSPPTVFINLDMPVDRIRFTLAHELGHIVMHHRSDLFELSNQIEDQAHAFASEFLMPRSEIRPHLRKLNLTTAAALKRHWRVSMAAVIMRARRVEAITSTEADTLWRDLSRRGWRKEEPNPIPRSTEDCFRSLRLLVESNSRILRMEDHDIERLFSVKSSEVRERMLIVPNTGASRLHLLK